MSHYFNHGRRTPALDAAYLNPPGDRDRGVRLSADSSVRLEPDAPRATGSGRVICPYCGTLCDSPGSGCECDQPSEDHEPEPSDPGPCPFCMGTRHSMGRLGRMEHFRCENCGGDSMQQVTD